MILPLFNRNIHYREPMGNKTTENRVKSLPSPKGGADLHSVPMTEGDDCNWLFPVQEVPSSMGVNNTGDLLYAGISELNKATPGCNGMPKGVLIVVYGCENEHRGRQNRSERVVQYVSRMPAPTAGTVCADARRKPSLPTGKNGSISPHPGHLAKCCRIVMAAGKDFP